MLAMWLRCGPSWQRDEGQDLIEYAVLLAIVAVGVILVAPPIREWVVAQFEGLRAGLGVET